MTPHDPTPRQLALYALPALGSSVIALPLALLIPAFYAQHRGIALASVGIAMAASRVLDMVTDPLVGTLSDRMRGRFGRRKAWLVVATPLLVLCVFRLFVPPDDAGVAYLAGWTAALFGALTLFDVPYRAWGAELSSDYDGRSRVAGAREAMGFGVQVLLLALAALAVSGDQPALELRALAWVFAIALPLCVTAAMLGVPEPRAEHVEHSQPGLSELRTPALGRILGAIVLFVSGVVMQGTLHRLVLTHALAREDLFWPMILVENLLTLLCVPLWMALARRVGKHRAIALGALWLVAGTLPLAFVPADAPLVFVGIVAVRGASFASILLLAHSLAADIVDADLVTSGRQRTGAIFGAWGVANKLSVGIGVLAATTIPAAFGFEPASDAHSAQALFGLTLGYVWLPAAGMLLGAPLLWNFPIDRARQLQLRASIADGARA